MELQNYRVAIYCRLSRDDGNEESQSIQTQREILTEYVNKQGWKIVDVYADDGYSGTDFDRPDFKRLLDDIEIGRIDLVITKDLSRLGRNYIQTGYYTEEYFPTHNVRYIALNDGFDTINEDGNDFVPFKNIINEWYAKDISKKVRFTLDNKAKNGEPRNTVFPIFGYAYNEAYERIPDPETAPIVQLIYRKYVEWGSSVKVARYLKSQKIKLPRYYNAIKYNYNKKKVLEMSEEQLIEWSADGVRDIIERKEYLGTYITAQSKSQNFKNKKRSDNKDCYVFENRYEPLIDKETWETANKIRVRTRSGTVPMEDNVFKGLCYCADCGNLMRYERRALTPKKDEFAYRYFCKHCNHSNSFPKHLLLKIIKQEFASLKTIILKKEDLFIDWAKTLDLKGRTLKVDTKSEMQKLICRNKEIDNYIQQLFEKNVSGIIPTSTFDMMMTKYNKEKQIIEDEIKSLTKKQQEELISPKNEHNAIMFVELLKSLDENSILKNGFLQKIIKKIVIKSRMINNSRKNKNYDVTITYSCCDELIKEFMNL